MTLVMTENVPFRKAAAKGISAAKDAESRQSSIDLNYSSQSVDPLIVMADCVEDLCQESVAAAIITEMFNVREMIENVSKKSCDRSFNALDILHLNKMSKLLNVEDSIDRDDPTISSNDQTLQRELAKFNLQLDKVQPDGDCAFRSIVRQITKRARDEPDRVSTHLKSLGLLIDEEHDTLTLRKLFVEAVVADKGGISSFIEGSMEEVLRKAREFRTKGIFDREIGDVVIRVCCNILQISIMVITSSKTVPWLSFKCDQSLTNEPIFIAFHYYGAGHYDATESIASDPLELESEGSQETVAGVCTCGRKAKSRSQRFCIPVAKETKSRCPCVLNKRQCQTKCRCLNCENREKHQGQSSCRCGEREKKESTARKTCTDVAGQRRTKCRCYKNGQPCSNLCSCNNCGNEYGQREAHTDSGTTTNRRRKITSSPPSLKRTRTTTFLENSGLEVRSGHWTTEETCLLDTVESFLCATSMLPSCKNIATLFNFVIKSHFAINSSLTANAKTVRQIQGKLDFAHKRQAALENLFYGISNLDN